MTQLVEELRSLRIEAGIIDHNLWEKIGDMVSDSEEGRAEILTGVRIARNACDIMYEEYAYEIQHNPDGAVATAMRMFENTITLITEGEGKLP